jgi:hypothetical protein
MIDSHGLVLSWIALGGERAGISRQLCAGPCEQNRRLPPSACGSITGGDRCGFN